jgi:hypothetical protein
LQRFIDGFVEIVDSPQLSKDVLYSFYVKFHDKMGHWTQYWSNVCLLSCINVYLSISEILMLVNEYH